MCFVVATAHSLQNFRCKRDDLNELLCTEFTSDWPENTSPNRFFLVVNQYRRVVVKTDEWSVRTGNLTGAQPASLLQGVPPILNEAGIVELPKANIAVLDGIRLSPNQPQTRSGVLINTIWGELAWELGGQSAYARVKEADVSGTSPGKEVLTQLIADHAPCVILIDELVAYIRQFEDGKSFSGGTYDSNLSFIQALTEAMKAVPDAVLLASLPESDKEAGSQKGITALAALSHYFGRVQALWKPVATEEALEIVRRRLFTNITDRA